MDVELDLVVPAELGWMRMSESVSLGWLSVGMCECMYMRVRVYASLGLCECE